MESFWLGVYDFFSSNIVILTIVLVLGVIATILETSKKITTPIASLIKKIKSKKDEKQKEREMIQDMFETLKEVKKTHEELKSHYSADNIAKRDAWMDWVNQRAEVYDEALNDLRELKESLKSSNELTLDLYINVNRHRIIDFAAKVIDPNTIVSREEFNRIFKVYQDYEDILEQHQKTNGEVNVAYRIIIEAYEEHMKHHSFLEDMRGYE